MLNGKRSRLLVLCVLLGAPAAPVWAQQTLNLTLGGFTPKGEDARVRDDVLNRNRTFLVFDVRDFTSGTIGGEWLIPFGQFVEGGAGIAFSRRTVPTVYEDYVDSDGTEVEQDLRLRIMPLSFTLRVLPMGQANALQPYFGAGIGIFNWRYSEAGEFIDFGAGRVIFRDQFVADGNRTGAVVLGGLRFGGETVSAGGEVRFHKAEADLDDRFAGSKLDLGGWVYQFTLGVRFR